MIAWTPDASLPPLPPVPVRVRGGVRPLQTLWPNFCQGFPPWGRSFKIFSGPLQVAAPCAVAPNQWGGVSLGEYVRAGVGEGGAFLNISPLN